MNQFYFAWVDPSETTFGVEHHREDEKIYVFKLDHTEGNFAALSIDIRNPHMGLLSPGRKVWAWLAYDDGTTVTPLFFGRLVGIPTNILADSCTLLFTAKPGNYISQKQALAESLKVAPWYDPIWIDATLVDDPDTILEGYSAFWHIDRTTLELTISDIMVGEDGEIVFLEADSFYDSVAITPQSSPLSEVKVIASISWNQVASGIVDMLSPTFRSEDLADLISNWPKDGDSLDSGWSVSSASAVDFWNIGATQTISQSDTYENTQETHLEGDTMSVSTSISQPNFNPAVPVRQVGTSFNAISGFLDSDGDPPVNIPSSISTTTDNFPTYTVPTSLILKYDANRQRSETIRFTLRADVQAILSLPEELDHPQWQANVFFSLGNLVVWDQSLYECALAGTSNFPPPTHSVGTVPDGGGVQWTFIQIDSFSDQNTIGPLTGRNVDLVMPDGTVPIVNPSRSSYFTTDRGQQSIQYLLARARATLLNRARAVQISFDCKMDKAIQLSCRKNARIFDPRIPGGNAVGKIIAYTIGLDGSNGQLAANLTIACPVGFANALTPMIGSGEYISNDYVEAAYQVQDGAQIDINEQIGYTRPGYGTIDDGIVFPLTKALALAPFGEAIGASTYNLTLRPLTNGPFSADYFLNVSKMVVPQGINLEAPSSP